MKAPSPIDLKDFRPCFLIAMPELEDPNFQKSVVLLTDFNEEGASGFVINRKTAVTLGETIVLTDGSLNPDYEDVNLYYGGPVDPEKIWIVYDGNILSNDEDTLIGDDVKIARDIDLLINQQNTLDTTRFRIFHGYSGWGAQQLDIEIASSAWIMSPLSRALLFDTPINKIWENAIRKMGFTPDHLVGPNSPFLN